MVNVRYVNHVLHVPKTFFNHAFPSYHRPRGARRRLRLPVITYFVPTHKSEHWARGRYFVGLKRG
jgi:hypothetical protein